MSLKPIGFTTEKENQIWDELQSKPKGLIFLFRLFCRLAVRIMWVNTANFINSPFTIHE
jgi:hypothetical protein